MYIVIYLYIAVNNPVGIIFILNFLYRKFVVIVNGFETILKSFEASGVVFKLFFPLKVRHLFLNWRIKEEENAIIEWPPINVSF
jgi:hypothetical protein